MIRPLALSALLASACGTFEEPSIVLDLRVIAMRTDVGPPVDDNGTPVSTKADQVVDVDLMNVSAIGEIVGQLEDTTVTAWVADPAQTRQLFWNMTLCLEDEDGRCDRSKPYLPIGAGVLDDPDLADVAQRPSPIISMGDRRTRNTVAAMLLRSIDDNPVSALGGVDLVIEMTIGGIDEPRELDLYAAKKLRISPRIPVDRRANTNPEITNLESALGLGNPIISPTRCGIASAGFIEMEPGESITLFPNETSSTREEYVVPGLDGTPQYLEETNSYQWLATYGGWSDETTGGGHDPFGNQSLLGSDWTAPRSIGGREFLDVSIWMIQRDERFGVTPLETCFRVRQP